MARIGTDMAIACEGIIAAAETEIDEELAKEDAAWTERRPRS